MIYLSLKGGLGNMLFQIAAGFSFSIKNNTKLGFLNLNDHLNYLNLDNTYNKKLNYSYDYLKLNQFKINDINVDKSITYNTYEYPFEFIDFIPPDNSIINGFFQSEKYFNDNRNEILNYFQPTQYILNCLKKYDFVKYKTTSIHIRRGDYLNNKDLHTVQSIDYFNFAIETLKEKTEKYIIFSDDIDWCKLNFIGDQFIFIENEKDYNELYLMSLCDNNIISNSSFGWWGAWMNKNNNKIVIAPEKWFGPANYQYSDKDIIPENWIKL
jgi:hypothetical protein